MAGFSVPTTYGEWSVALNRLKDREQDEENLRVMKLGTIEWQAGIADRFSKKLIEVVNVRLNAASDRFQRDMSHSYGQERGMVQALAALRRELSFLGQVVSLPVLPEKDRGKYYGMVKDQAAKMQKSLEDSAKRDRTGKLSVIVRNNKVDVL